MWPTKRLILLWAIIATISQIFSVHQSHASDDETYFIATAYYSPVENQKKYSYSSYLWRYRTFEEEKRLQGEWHTTASWKWVFEWLLAWPKNYPFGTKIYFEWFGIWVVEDRWWAIRKAWWWGKCDEYDCIDIWMWYGDEWLARAKKWWVRKIKWKIVVPSAEVTLKLWESPLGYFDNLRVHPKSGVTEVKHLQEIFTKADLYTGEIDGQYQSIRNELIEFQIKNNIISWYADEEAGYFWPKTVEILQKLYASDVSMLVEEDVSLFSEFNHHHASELYKTILAYGDLQVGPDSDSKQIEQLQRLLVELGEYDGSIDGKYNSVENALIDLQIKIGLVEKRDDWGAWYFGNKTKTALWIYYEKNSDEPEQITLSRREEEKISTALSQIKKRLKSEELKWWRKMDTRLNSLKIQIETSLPKVDDDLLRAKLIYLKQLL